MTIEDKQSGTEPSGIGQGAVREALKRGASGVWRYAPSPGQLG